MTMTYTADSDQETTSSSDPELHKNEGFLKSMWHTLTNHPAHQKKEDGSSSTKDDSKAADSKKDDSKKDDSKKSTDGNSS